VSWCGFVRHGLYLWYQGRWTQRRGAHHPGNSGARLQGGTTQSIVSGILYNGYGQISKLSYGNGTYTDYDYNVSGTGASTLKKNTLFKTTTTAKEQGAPQQLVLPSQRRVTRELKDYEDHG